MLWPQADCTGEETKVQKSRLRVTAAFKPRGPKGRTGHPPCASPGHMPRMTRTAQHPHVSGSQGLTKLSRQPCARTLLDRLNHVQMQSGPAGSQPPEMYDHSGAKEPCFRSGTPACAGLLEIPNHCHLNVSLRYFIMLLP